MFISDNEMFSEDMDSKYLEAMVGHYYTMPAILNPRDYWLMYCGF